MVPIVSGLSAVDDIECLNYILDKKNKVIPFLHSILQNNDEGELLHNAIVAWGNIAYEIQYRDLLFQTNFLAKIRSICKNPKSAFYLVIDVLFAMKNFAKKVMPKNAVDIFIEILSEFLYSNNDEILINSVEVIIEMSNSSEIASEANDQGIFMRLTNLLIDKDKDSQYQLRLKILTAIGGLASTVKREPIDDILSDGILDNLFQIWESSDVESLEKILWICSNITSSSKEAAVTVYHHQLFGYALESLCQDEFTHTLMK